MKVVFSPPPRWPWRGGSLAASVLGVLALLASPASHAQTYNINTASTAPGSLYHRNSFTNTATGIFANAGAAIYYAGPSTATFVNNGSYTATLNGAAFTSDQFIGPGGTPGLQEIAGSVAPTFYNLVLANGATSPFTVSNPAGVTITSQLTLANGITTTTTATSGAGALRITNTGSQATSLAGNNPSSTTYVDGYVAKSGTTSAFTYPLGDTNNSGGNTTAVGTNIFSPITLSQPGGTAIRYVADATPAPSSFSTQGGGLQLVSVSRVEYYPIATIGVPAGSTITIPYGNFGPTPKGTPYVSDPNRLTIAAFDGTRWTNLSATVNNTINTTARTVTVTLPVALSTTYQLLTLASTSTANPLPVQLTTFTATARGFDGLLNWQTASELNSEYFELQASGDGQTWQPLGKVAGAGTSTTVHRYSFSDLNISRYGVPVVYYRLRQVDRDGTQVFSPVVTLTIPALTWSFTAFPNPFTTSLTAQLTTSETGPVRVTLLDAVGRVIVQREVVGRPGSQAISLDGLPDLTSGNYILLVRQNDHSSSARVVHK